MNRIEILLGSLALLTLSADLLGAPMGGVFMILSFSSLACFYMYFAFPVLNLLPLKMFVRKGTQPNQQALGRRFSQLIGLAIAIVVIGILFKLMQWPNADIYLMGGIAGLTIAEIFIFLRLKKAKTHILATAMKRIAIFGIVGIVFLTA